MLISCSLTKYVMSFLLSLQSFTCQKHLSYKINMLFLSDPSMCVTNNHGSVGKELYCSCVG